MWVGTPWPTRRAAPIATRRKSISSTDAQGSPSEALTCPWVCKHCETLIQVPMAKNIIDKGIPKGYLDRLPLYRQENMFAAGDPVAPRRSAGRAPAA